jgi:LRR-repeat protein 1
MKPFFSTKPNSRQAALMLCTGKGTQVKKYEVKNNVLKLFTKFIGHGKATVIFRHPSHQLFISKADPAQLKKFLKLLTSISMSPKGREASVMDLPELPDPVALFQSDEQPKLRMMILKRQDYPLRDGFPSTLETLVIQGCMLSRVDSRIMQLDNLCTLDLSNNKIKELPELLCNLVNLADLRVTANQLSSFPDLLCQPPLSHSLKTLDLSDNLLVSLPGQFGHITSLVILNLANNQLKSLPFSFHWLRNLRKLSLLNNRLSYLPSNMHRLQLDTLDISGNDFYQEDSVQVIQSRLGVLPLLELSARVVKCHHLPYNTTVLPRNLCTYLETCRTCMCGNPCFVGFEHCVVTVDSQRLARTAITNSKGGVSMEAFLCSFACKKWYVSHGCLVV